MKKLYFLLIIVLLMSACADTETINECVSTPPYGFWSGLWHGWISTISFIVSLFSDNVSVYAVNNTGGWYDFGFLLGIGSFTVTTSKTVK